MGFVFGGKGVALLGNGGEAQLYPPGPSLQDPGGEMSPSKAFSSAMFFFFCINSALILFSMGR